MDDLLQRLYQVFSTGPLTSKDQDLYVELDPARGSTGVVQRLAKQIRLSAEPTCQVLTGHKGSGKSTELRKLQAEMEQTDRSEKPYFVVFCEADEDIDRNDVDFPEVLIAILRQTATQLKKRLGISLKPSYLKDRLERLKGLLTSEVDLKQLDIGVGLLKLSGQIKNSPEARLEIRKCLEPDTNNWITAANDIFSQAALELNKKNYRGLVVIVDDLDKMVLREQPEAKCSTQEHLFVNRGPQLRALNCHVIYTMPIELAYSHLVSTLESTYGGLIPVIPMTKIASRPPRSKPYIAGLDCFRKVLAARLRKAGATKKDVFKGDARERIIQISGGQPTELMTLMREALVTHGLPIDKDAVERARREGMRAYARLLREEHWPLLMQVKATGNITRSLENEAALRELLQSRSILLYMNDDEWYGLNPLVAALKPPSRAGRRR